MKHIQVVSSGHADLRTSWIYFDYYRAYVYAFSEPGHSLSRRLNEIAQNAVNCSKEIHFSERTSQLVRIGRMARPDL